MTTPPPPVPPPGQDPYYDAGFQPAPSPYSPAEAYPVSPYQHNPYPYGVDPLTGVPYSDKSKVIAGLLQLLPGFFVGLGGIGRLYARHTTLGVVQIIASVVGWTSAVCGAFLLFPLAITALVWLWFVIDGIVILAGRSTDGQGHLLRT
jgi:hypothetical protein